MVDENTELVPMDSVYQDLHFIDLKFYDYKQLINRCTELGIPDAENSLLKIILLDYIMANTDRHSFNISFIRDSNTLQWKGTAPVYDTGKSMFLNLLDFEMQIQSSSKIEAKPFSGTQAEQIKNLPIKKISPFIDLHKLDDIDQWYTNFLSPLKRLSNEKKTALVKKLRERIEETKAILKVEPASVNHTEEKLCTSDVVYAALKKNPRQTKEQVSNATGLSRATVTRTYKVLEEQGKIKRIGSNKSGYWKVL